MRHGNRNNALGRTASHRSAMLSNMACSLIEHKRINTTLAKAKTLRKFVEPLITKSKTDSTHSRRLAFSTLKSKDAVTELFREVAPKVANREGGYTRIIKLGNRLGDAAEMCMIELVDFNELMLEESKSKTRKSRRGGKKKAEAGADAPKAEKATEVKPKAEANADAPAKEEAKADEAKSETDEPKAEAKIAEKPEAKKDDSTAEENNDDNKDKDAK